MKLLKSIKLIGGALLFSSGVLMTSCDFLDIVPPEQVGMDDTVKDANETEDFLYSCYANVNNPIQYRNVEASAKRNAGTTESAESIKTEAKQSAESH